MDEEKTVKQLQQELRDKGVLNAELFTSKAQIRTVLDMQGTPAPKTDEPVATIDPPANPVEERNVERRWQKKADHMRRKLEHQTKVRILVPLEANEKQGVVEWRKNAKTGKDEQVIISGDVQPVTLNGYAYYVPKGIYVEVPEQVANVITEKFNQTAEAGQSARLDRLDPTTGRPVAEQL